MLMVISIGASSTRSASQPESKRDDADEVVGEIAPRGRPCRRVQERREKHEEDDVRGEGYAWNSRDETQQQASDDEANRIRRLQPLSERGEHGDEDQQQE